MGIFITPVSSVDYYCKRIAAGRAARHIDHSYVYCIPYLCYDDGTVHYLQPYVS